jgi:L-Ala-D/L-Glu epimerase
MFKISAYEESWPIEGSFTISRGSKTSANVIVVEIEKNGVKGWGESVPYTHYGESCAQTLKDIQQVIPLLEKGCSRQDLLKILPRGAARNAIDSALLDFECKTTHQRAWKILNVPEPQSCATSLTISLDTQEKMYEDAKIHAHYPLLKMKIGPDQGLEKMKAVRRGAPQSKLIVDANESWTIELIEAWLPELQALKIDVIEQPLKAGYDQALIGRSDPIPYCADESCRNLEDLDSLSKAYSMINIKLDKTGGLTEALNYVQKAQDLNLKIMVGCMVATSLSMAPAMMLSSFATYIDLDGPLLLAKDRHPGLIYHEAFISPPTPHLWG